MSATNPIFAVFNRQTGQLAPGVNGSVATMPDLPQGNIRDLKIQFVDPSGAGLSKNPWTTANMSAFTLACYVSAQPLGTGGPAAVAFTLAGGFTYDAANNWWTGSLDLTPAGVTSLIGGNPSVAAFLEFDVSFSGNTVLTTLTPLKIFAVVNKSVTPNPLPAASYPTTNQANASYYPIAGRAGQAVRLISKGGTIVDLIANDDGTTSSTKI